MMTNWTITTRRELGAPYVIHTLRLAGAAIYSQIGPISSVEAKARIADHLAPKPTMKPFTTPAYNPHRSKPGRKPKGWVAPTGDAE